MLPTNQIAGFFKMKYPKKEEKDEVYFWYADKHRRFLQVDTINLPKVSKIRSFNICAISPEKQVRLSCFFACR